jgi:hypothetical protein
MRGDFGSSDPEELAEFAGMCLNTVIHLGMLAVRLGVEEPEVEE